MTAFPGSDSPETGPDGPRAAVAPGHDAAPADAGAGHPGYQPAPPRDASPAASRSLLVRALHDTFGRTGARVGAAWVVFLIVVAVFAPFLANSRPYFVRLADGSWASPLVRGLDWVDLALLGAFVAAAALLAARRAIGLSFGMVLLGFVAFTGAVTLTGLVVLDPPQNEIFQEWREAQAQGRIVSAVRAPIPFSANDRLGDVGNARLAAPWWSPNGRAEALPTSHLLGTTVNGEDMASRMIYATRVALSIGFVATSISTLIGVVYGAIMGYAGGVVDLLMMRLIEIVQAVPRIILLLIVTVFFGKNIWYMMVTIGLVSWTGDARFIRAEFLKLRGQEFVQAARAAGLPTRSILFRHMLPNGVAPVLVNASFGVATAILLESVLSFLGLGLEATDPSWGQLLNQARSGGTGFNWWIATFPGLAIFLTVFAYILIGEAMRDAIDPKTRKAG